MKAQKIFKTKFILILILSLALALSAVGLISVNKVKANTSNLPELVLPGTKLEYKNLTTAKDVYLDDSITAILQNEEILLYVNGEYKQPITTPSSYLTSLKQIKKLNDDTLLFSSNGNIFNLTISTGDISEFMPSLEIGGNYFDFNGNYFVTVYGDKAQIYKFTNGEITNDPSIPLNANGNYSIAINDNNQIFYVDKSTTVLHKYDFTSTPTTLNITPSPAKMIANNDYVYYILNNDVCRININGGSQEILSTTSNFDLGKLNTTIGEQPKSLSFKGDNLLVTNNDAIQEFRVTDKGELEFSGFAIAKGKSAFNRINDTVKEIEREKDTLATLDDNNLTLINVGEGFNSYNKDLFSHVATSSLKKNEELPTSFALGDNSALFLYDVNNINSRNCLAFLPDISKPEISDVSIENGLNYTDIVYQSGKYYVLSHKNAASSQVYVSSQSSTLSFSLFAEADGVHASQMAIDVFGNVYLSTDSSVYALNKETKTATALNSTPISNIKKLETDLAGKVFALCDTDIYCYNGNEWSSVAFDTQGKTFSSATIDYDKKDVYVIYSGEELIVKTSALPNVAIDDIKPQTFVATASSAKDDLKTYTAKAGANVYSVNKTESGFTFNELIAEPTDYAFITQITKDNVTLFALAGQDQLVLINSNEVTETTPTKDFAVPENAFITTSVNAYYLPIITEKAEYALTDGEVVRLSKEQIIKPKHKITFLNKDYYFAEFTLGEKTYNGYLPIDYTIEVLSQDFKWDNYTIENVSATTVYREKELVNAITELADDTSVRVISIENDVAFIAFETENGYINGFIDASDIKDNPSVAIRNILIIIAVMASVCGTTTYFILRKKR